MEHIGQFILNHWVLCLAFLMTIALIYFQEYQAKKNRGQAVSPHMAVQLINRDNAAVIDLRDKEAFVKGHITDAIHATSEDFDLPRLTQYKTLPLILVAGRELQMDALVKKLREKSYKQPMILTGGIDAWQAAGLPLIKKKATNVRSLPKKAQLLDK